jgi:hypothetical protein
MSLFCHEVAILVIFQIIKKIKIDILDPGEKQR